MIEYQYNLNHQCNLVIIHVLSHDITNIVSGSKASLRFKWERDFYSCLSGFIYGTPLGLKTLKTVSSLTPSQTTIFSQFRKDEQLYGQLSFHYGDTIITECESAWQRRTYRRLFLIINTLGNITTHYFKWGWTEEEGGLRVFIHRTNKWY